ncbi:histidine kinase [Psychromonas marina]|uniref:Sensor protein n=1 Tax=Psychromonas marina TaxID=88364 RepID=A0ABQ6E3A9_9GAMM|nr:histidine kinase [Psychromonas marina]GLS91685.1 histidine kinase [Psychromonas marina]
MILIISAAHIISVFTTFDSHIENIKIIDNLTSLKISTTGLLYASQYHPQDLPTLIQQIDTQLANEPLFQSSWFNTQQINQTNQKLANQWAEIHSTIDQLRFTETEVLLPAFYDSLDNIVKQYQVLAKKKIHIIHLAEFISFLITMMIGVTLYLYSKKQIVQPIKQLLKNVQAIKAHQFDLPYPYPSNEIGVLSQGIKDTSSELDHLISTMQKQVSEQTVALEKANQTIEFLYSISQQLSTVKLTSPILYNALNALARQANLDKLCLELNNGTFINSEHGCAGIDQRMRSIPIIINGKPFGFLNYVLKQGARDQYALIESFTGLVARALYQEEHSLQAQKILLMEERNIIARELHDSIAQSLSFLNIQCTLLHRQVDHSQQQAQQTIGNIEEAVSDAYIQLRSLLSTFRLSVTESNFKEALLTMIKTLQKQTAAPITIKQFESYFYTDASQHIHLLQIVREAIINAIKHSQCSHIEISCIITDQHKVWISIIDDGQGIVNNSEKDNHYGLSIMKQRADELGATLSFNSLIQGTEVKLIFPYKKSILNQGAEND